MANGKTEAANHNRKELDSLVIEFRAARKAFFEKLHTLDDSHVQHMALHPRLQQMVNVADILYFIGEHDNHHLTLISSLLPARV